MMYALSFYIQGGYYQMFNGVSPEDVDVAVNFIDNVSGDIIDSGSYRAWVDNMEESSSFNDNTDDVSSSAIDTVPKTLKLNET